MGDFIEDAVRPAAVRLFQSRGIIVHEVQQNVSVQRGEEGLEIDLMVVNDSEAVAVEFVFSGRSGDVVRTASVEVGDFAAGRAFLKVAQR